MTIMLQQCLPLAVLKPPVPTPPNAANVVVATVPTACGIETLFHRLQGADKGLGCNSTYRLLY